MSMSTSRLSVLMLGEIRAGVESVGARDPAKAAALDAWLRLVTEEPRQRILVDYQVAPALRMDEGTVAGAGVRLPARRHRRGTG
jgi:hypothetical protein